MSKIKRMAQAVRARALAALEKNSSAAREGENSLNDNQRHAGTNHEGPAADSASPGASNSKSLEPGLISCVGCPSLVKQLTWNGKKAGVQQKFSRGGSVPDIFPDGDVCRLLGKNRAYLIQARKSKSRGEDWDVIGHHAGMTASWILKKNPKADLEHITQWRIKPGDGVVSVEVLQHTMDFRKLACKRLSDGVTVVVMVDDASRFRDGDQFDAQELGGTYRWNPALNRI